MSSREELEKEILKEVIRLGKGGFATPRDLSEYGSTEYTADTFNIRPVKRRFGIGYVKEAKIHAVIHGSNSSPDDYPTGLIVTVRRSSKNGRVEVEGTRGSYQFGSFFEQGQVDDPGLIELNASLKRLSVKDHRVDRRGKSPAVRRALARQNE